jgi:hypothetical protein
MGDYQPRGALRHSQGAYAQDARQAVPAPFPGACPAPGVRASQQPAQPPPASGRPRYPIADSQTRSYANLFSLISTIDVVQQTFAEGTIDVRTRDSILKLHLGQFNTVISSLQLTLADVERFCDASGLQRFYAWPVITNPPDFSAAAPPPQDQVLPAAFTATHGRSGIAFDISRKIVELSDMCFMATQSATLYLELLGQVHALFQTIGAVPRDTAITAFLEKWLQYVRSLRGSDLPLQKIDELKAEMVEFNIAAKRFFTH